MKWWTTSWGWRWGNGSLDLYLINGYYVESAFARNGSLIATSFTSETLPANWIWL